MTRHEKMPAIVKASSSCDIRLPFPTTYGASLTGGGQISALARRPISSLLVVVPGNDTSSRKYRHPELAAVDAFFNANALFRKRVVQVTRMTNI